MQPSQLDILPPEQATILIRKKRFWKRAMWLALAITPLFLAMATKCHSMAMSQVFGTIITVGQIERPDGFEKSMDEISLLVVTTKITLSLAALASLLFLTALIRSLSLPKLPSPPPDT